MTKILIAEDDKFLASALRVKLTKAGFAVVVAVDGVETLAQAKAEKPNLIILDIIMPEKDGFAVLAELKADPDLRLIPVVVASNLGQAEDVQKGKELGAIDYIVKSDLSLDELVEKIPAWLK